MKRNRALVLFIIFPGLLLLVLIALFLNVGDFESGHKFISLTTKAGTLTQGVRIYNRAGCGTCHGHNGKGTARGPSLLKLEEHWQKAKLVEFLKNPLYYVKNDNRLKAMSRKYYPIQMPAYDMLSSKELHNLADFLLNLQ